MDTFDSETSETTNLKLSVGAKFVRGADQRHKRAQEVAKEFERSTDKEKKEDFDKASKETKDDTEQQILRLLKELPGHVSVTFAYYLHKSGKLEPKVYPPLEQEEFEERFQKTRAIFHAIRRREVRKRRRMRRNYMRLNLGYSEPDPIYEIKEQEFQGPWRTESMKEDFWKAEYYQSVQRDCREIFPERGYLASRTDRIADVMGAAFRSHFADRNRPVLTHELADFDNAYMMKKSAVERILHERCVRNQLDERCLPRLVESLPDLVKLRSKASLPPEVLEPIAAFRGDVRWHFDPKERLAQKLDGVNIALDALSKQDWTSQSSNKDWATRLATVSELLPENLPPSANQVPGVHHPWKGHVGFESAVPRGTAGGINFGKPERALDAEVHRLRYPTLQRVAHTLPKDIKWRAHVVRSIEILERSRHWDYESKLRAINTMKEVYDSIQPSAHYTRGLDENLRLNRVDSRLKRKYAPGVQFVRTFPKHFVKKKTNSRYRPSLTTLTPAPPKKEFKPTKRIFAAKK